MALSIGFRIFSFLPSCYSSYGALNFYPGGTFTHCSCQPSLDAHFTGVIGGHAAICGHSARTPFLPSTEVYVRGKQPIRWVSPFSGSSPTRFQRLYAADPPACIHS